MDAPQTYPRISSEPRQTEDPETDALDLFESLKRLFSEREWQPMPALAAAVAALGMRVLSGDEADLSPESRNELCLKWWLTDFGRPKHEQTRQRAITALTPSGTAPLVDNLDRFADRAITRLKEAGEAGEFDTAGITGTKAGAFEASLWPAVVWVEFWSGRLTLADGTVIGGVRKTEPGRLSEGSTSSTFWLG